MENPTKEKFEDTKGVQKG